MTELRDVLGALRALDARESAVLATLVRIQGSSYRRPGARMLVGRAGRLAGTLSGGCLETDAILRAQRFAPGDAPRLLTYDLRGDAQRVWGHGLGCEGVAEVLFEAIAPRAEPEWLRRYEACLRERRHARLWTGLGRSARWPLGRRQVAAPNVVPPPGVAVEPILPPLALCAFGGGEDARPLAALAQAAGFEVTVVDHRSACVDRRRFPGAGVLLRAADDGIEGLPLDSRGAAIVMTHAYLRDRDWLAALLPSGVGYLGLLGPRRRSEALLQELALGGVRPTPDQSARLYAPAGLDLGAKEPETIALAIVAEAHAVLAGRAGGSLRERRGSIHEEASAVALAAGGER